MKVKYVAEGKRLVKVVEKGDRVKKEILAVGDPEVWAKKLGVELYVEPKPKKKKGKKKKVKDDEDK